LELLGLDGLKLPPSGVRTLGDIAAQFPEKSVVSCNRCERRGVLRTARLLAEHGPNIPGPELSRILAADCPKMIEGKMHDVCGIHFPGLSG
jgi:hypothetical protein